MEETELGSVHGPEVTGTHRIVPRSLDRGDVVGRYVVVDVLGHGGMGVVYSAYDPELDRRVALKLLLPRREAGGASRGRARLIREAQALAKLNHPNVVTVHDVGEHDGRVFVAMEFIAGVTLETWIRRGPHAWKQVLEVFTRAGRGLMEAHAHRMTHRDFKPDNVMIADGTARVVVMDFGLAMTPMTANSSGPRSDAEAEFERALSPGDEAEALTRTGSVVGTPAYMAPEQYAGSPGPASDQFSFCVTLYEALYGQRPFRGSSSPELLAAALYGKFQDPPPGDRVPRWLREVVLRGLAADPNDRWPTMEALLDALHADPSRRRWFMATAVGAALLAGGLYGGRVLQQRQHRVECEERVNAVDGAWGESDRDRVGGAFAASALPYATDAWRRAEANLDQSAQRWSQARLDSCLTESNVDTPLRLARDACLEARLERISTVVRILSEPDAGVIQRASQLADIDIDPCTDDALLRAQPPILADPVARDARKRLERELNDASSLQTAGKLEHASQLQEKVLEEARARGDQQVLARAQYQLGLTRKLQTRYHDAAPLFEDAYFEAMRTSSRDLARSAALVLTDLYGEDLNDTATARRWARHSQLLIDESSKDQAELDLAVARTELAAGDVAKGMQQGLRALRVFESEEGPHSDRAVRARLVLMVAHDRQGDLDEALAFAREVLESRLEAYGPDHPKTVQARINVSAALLPVKRFEEAEQHLQRVIEGTQPPNLDTASALDNLSLIRSFDGRAEEAAALNDQVLELRERLLSKDHLRVAHTLRNGAHINQRLGNVEKALEYIRRAKEIYRRNGGETSPYIIPTGRAEASLLLALRRPRDAVDLLEALWRREVAARIEPSGPVMVGTDLAVALIDLGDPERALEVTTATRANGEWLEAVDPELRLSLDELHATALLATGATGASIDVLEAALARARVTDCCAQGQLDAGLVLDIARWTATGDAEARARVEVGIEAMAARQDPEEAVTLRRLRSVRPAI